MSDGEARKMDAAMWERMEKVIREVATWTWIGQSSAADIYSEARCIVDELPNPVDPVLLEARRVGADTQATDEVDRAQWLTGMYDRIGWTEGYVAGLKSARAQGGEK